MPNLYVVEPGTVLETEAGRLVVSRQDHVLKSVPAARVDQVVVAGHVGVTVPVLSVLLDRGIGLVMLTSRGAFKGRLSGDLAGSAALRRRQYQRAEEPDFGLRLGRRIVAGKIRNCRTLCLRWDETPDNPAARRVAGDLARLAEAVDAAPNLAALMGCEGRAARSYFGYLGRCLRSPWVLARRARRPPPDPVNALLSLLYTLLHENCYAALEAVGLDPYCGYLHQSRHGRASLALDLMEEFRPVIADSAMVTLLNKRMLTPDDFYTAEDGGVFLKPEGWGPVARVYERRLRQTIRPPGLAKATTYQRLLEIQARRMRHLIEGSVAEYEPFAVK